MTTVIKTEGEGLGNPKLAPDELNCCEPKVIWRKYFIEIKYKYLLDIHIYSDFNLIFWEICGTSSNKKMYGIGKTVQNYAIQPTN